MSELRTVCGTGSAAHPVPQARPVSGARRANARELAVKDLFIRRLPACMRPAANGEPLALTLHSLSADGSVLPLGLVLSGGCRCAFDVGGRRYAVQPLRGLSEAEASGDRAEMLPR